MMALFTISLGLVVVGVLMIVAGYQLQAAATEASTRTDAPTEVGLSRARAEGRSDLYNENPEEGWARPKPPGRTWTARDGEQA